LTAAIVYQTGGAAAYIRSHNVVEGGHPFGKRRGEANPLSLWKRVSVRGASYPLGVAVGSGLGDGIGVGGIGAGVGVGCWIGGSVTKRSRSLTSWFGIRKTVGSCSFLTYVEDSFGDFEPVNSV
jgi:hypothetical protein